MNNRIRQISLASILALVSAFGAAGLAHSQPQVMPSAAYDPRFPAQQTSFSVAEPQGLVSDTSRNRLFVASKSSNAVVVWDEASGQTIANIRVGSQPWGIGLTNNRVFVANFASSTISVIDAISLSKMTDINLNNSRAPVQCPGAPANVAVDASTQLVYVALYGMGRVAVINAATNALTDCLSAGGGTTGVAVNSALNQLYATNRDAMTLQVFDTSTNPATLIQTVSLGGVPYFVQSNPNTNQVYVTVAYDAPDYGNARTLQVFSAAHAGVALTTSATIGNAADGGTVWVNQVNGSLYVAATQDNELEILNPTSFAITQRISIIDPVGITENRALNRIYVGSRAASLVQILSDGGGTTPTPTNTATNTPTQTATSTPTNTPTSTPTNTPTLTPTATPTSTSTPTPSATPTNTSTPTPSNTPTSTSTPDLSATPTNTPTNTPTSTSTSTPTATPTWGSVCALVYNDLNVNASRDVGEPLLSGAEIVLKDSGNNVVGRFVTNGTEPRCFTNLTPGAYTVTENDPPAFASTTPGIVTANVTANATTSVEFGDSISQPNGMVSDASRHRLYVTSRDTGWLLIWDEVNQRVLTTIKVGSLPWGVGLVNDRVFVSNSNSATVSVISAATMTRMTDINLAPLCSGGPAHIAVNPNTQRVYVAMYGSGRVAVIDATTNTVVGCLNTGLGTFGVAVNSTLNQLYVGSRDAMTLQVFDLSASPGVLLQTVSLGGSPFFVQANSNTNQVYAAVAHDVPDYSIADTLYVFTASSSGITLTTAPAIGNTDDGGTIWVSQATGRLYIAATADNELEILDPSTFNILQRISMTDPLAITEDIGLGKIYIANRSANRITIVSDNLP